MRWTARWALAHRAPIVESIDKEHAMNDSFKGLRVAITGGTSGLGLALVQALQRRGAQVAWVARHAEAPGIAGDVSRKEDIHPIALRISAALGGLDVLINNASSLGPAPLQPLADTECEDFEAALATNVLGPFRLTKALLGALSASAREGRPALVVNITSDAAVNAYAGWGAYTAASLDMLTTSAGRPSRAAALKEIGKAHL